MQLEFDEEQLALQESVRRFLTERYDFETRRGCLAQPFGSSAGIWQAFAEQGFLSIGLPEAHGGIGGATELMLTALRPIPRTRTSTTVPGAACATARNLLRAR